MAPVLAAPAAAAPTPIRTEALPAGAELRNLDDAGRVTVVTREEGRRRVMRRGADGTWTTLLDLAGAQAASDGRVVDVGGDAAGRLVVAWGTVSPSTDVACAPRCLDAVHVGRAEGDGPLREIARLPTVDGRGTLLGVGPVDMGTGGDAELGFSVFGPGVVDQRVRVSGDAVAARPASAGEPVLRRVADDGTRYGVRFRSDGPTPVGEVVRQAPGGEPVPLSLGIKPGIGHFDLEPLSGGRLLVLGFTGDGATDPTLHTEVVDATGRVVARTVHPGATGPGRRAAVTPGGGRLLSVRRAGREELMSVSPAGEVALLPWPGGGPPEGAPGTDRSGAVLLAELRPRAGGSPADRVFRLRRLSAYGGEDPAVEVSAGAARFGGFDFDALRTSSLGAVAAVAPASPGGSPTLLWRGPDALPPTVRARARTVRGVPREVVVRVRCDEGCQVRGGRLRAAAADRASLRAARPAAARLRAGRTVAVRLRLTAAQRRGVARTHRRGRSRRVVLRPVVRDPLGNARRVRVGVRLRPARR